MPISKPLMTHSLAILVIIASIFTSVISVANPCVEQLSTCVEDCDCCGFGTVRGTVCQTRHHLLGPRCHIFRRPGEECTDSEQCRSQNCDHGICQHVARDVIHIPLLCAITYETDELTGIIGELTTEEGTCPCDNPEPFPENACEKVLFKEPYVNNYPINSGFTVTPSFHFPLRKLVFCTSDQDPVYDPSCFKLEGRCKGSDDFIVLHEGDLMLPLTRKQCMKIHVPDQNFEERKEYEEFKLTFPCQRGGFTNCTTGCQDYPVRIDMIRLMGNCRDRNYCKIKANVLSDLTGNEWKPPAGGCPNCAHTMSYPHAGSPGKSLDGTIAPYINYKAIGSGVIFEKVQKPVHLMRLYPANFDVASDPVSYEIYGADYQQNYQLLNIGILNFPKERNTVGLEYYVDVIFKNNIHYQNIQVIFLDIEGNFNTTCVDAETCKDYPLVIGEIELYGWC